MDFGPSRELFELWAPDSRNGVIITGYSIEGTLARVSLILIYLRDHITYSMYILAFFNGNIFSSSPVPELGKLKVPDV
jgi:Cft2 family RNA processing exonuclease